MPINGIMTLAYSEAQKKHPKGKAVEGSIETAFKEVSKIKSKFPYKPEAKKMSYGSKGEAYGG